MTTSDEKKDSSLLFDAFKTLGAIVGSLGSLTVLFVAVGYIIVLSYINKLKLYGLTDFPKEFFMAANIQFINDFAGFMTEHFVIGPLVFIFFLILFQLKLFPLITRYRILAEKNNNDTDEEQARGEKSRAYKMKWVLILSIFVLIFLTLNPGLLLKPFIKLIGNSHQSDLDWISKLFLYSISIPLLFALSFYLIRNIRLLAHSKELVLIIMFALLNLAIPFSYGRDFYDLDVHIINALEYDQKYESVSLRKLRGDIVEKRGGIYYLMGHTAGKKIFIDSASYPKEVIIIDNEAIKFLGVKRPFKLRQTLRSILSPVSQTYIAPEEEEETTVSAKEEEDELRELIKEINAEREQ